MCWVLQAAVLFLVPAFALQSAFMRLFRLRSVERLLRKLNSLLLLRSLTNPSLAAAAAEAAAAAAEAEAAAAAAKRKTLILLALFSFHFIIIVEYLVDTAFLLRFLPECALLFFVFFCISDFVPEGLRPLQQTYIEMLQRRQPALIAAWNRRSADPKYSDAVAEATAGGAAATSRAMVELWRDMTRNTPAAAAAAAAATNAAGVQPHKMKTWAEQVVAARKQQQQQQHRQQHPTSAAASAAQRAAS